MGPKTLFYFIKVPILYTLYKPYRPLDGIP